MTVVVGLVHERKAYIMADSMSADDRGVYNIATMRKIIRVPGPVDRGPCPSLLFGFTTSWRFGQVAEQALVEASWRAPRHPETPEEAERQPAMPWPRGSAELLRDDEDAEYIRRWMVGWTIPILREALKAAAWSEVKDNVQKGGFALAAIRGRLFKVQSDFSVVAYAAGYDAVGAGEEVAVGALAATADMPLTVERRLEIVAQAVERHMVWVRGPWRTEWA